MRLAEAQGWRGIVNSPKIGVMAALREEAKSSLQNPSGRFVRTDLDYVEGVAEAGGDACGTAAFSERSGG